MIINSLNKKERDSFPKITIITPSYNQGQYIEQTILSVLNQNYPNLEYIIIDGGSKDNSVEIIKKYADKLTYWVSEPDKGQSDAINKGLRLATGDIINWLNSDDYHEPHTLHTIAKAFTKPNVMVVCGRGRLFRHENETAYYSQGTDVYPGNLAKTIGWARMDQPETFFSKAAINKMGLLDTRLHYLMDRDWWLKYLFLFRLEGVKIIPDVLVNFRLHADSKTVSQNAKFQVEHDTFYYSFAKSLALDKYATLIKSLFRVNENIDIELKYPYDRDLVEKALNYYFLKRADETYAQNDKTRTQQLLNNIQDHYLEKEDLALKNKLYFRNKYIPQFILKALRRG